MITFKKPLSWFDEMNMRYEWRKLIAGIFGLSQAYLAVTESSYSTAKAMEEFNKAMEKHNAERSR